MKRKSAARVIRATRKTTRKKARRKSGAGGMKGYSLAGTLFKK